MTHFEKQEMGRSLRQQVATLKPDVLATGAAFATIKTPRGSYRITRDRLLNHSDAFIKQLVNPPKPAKMPGKRNPHTPAPAHLRLRVAMDSGQLEATPLREWDFKFLDTFDEEGDRLRAERKRSENGVTVAKAAERDNAKHLRQVNAKVLKLFTGQKPIPSELLGDQVMYEREAARCADLVEEALYNLASDKEAAVSHIGWKYKAARQRTLDALATLAPK